MKIGIDMRALQDYRNRGIGTYVYNLAKGLLDLQTDERFVFYLFEDGSGTELVNNHETFYLKRHRRCSWLWQQLPQFSGDVDMLHFPLALGPSKEIVLPYFQTRRTIATVHDLCLHRLPDGWSQYISHSKEYRIQERALRKTSRIIAISHATRKDLVENLGIPADKIRVIHQGVDTCVFRKVEKSTLQKTKKKYCLPDTFILAVGDDYKKNMGRLFRAFSLLPDIWKLIVVGNPSQVSLVNELGLQHRIVFLGKISREELVSLYNLASVLAFPSICEGFGLPLLEAMACGCAVVTSNVSSPPEVVGDAGILVNPYDEKEIAKGIRDVVEDRNLRNKLIDKGLGRVQQFSWENTAKQVLKVYHELT